jgi:hypothetical protein
MKRTVRVAAAGRPVAVRRASKELPTGIKEHVGGSGGGRRGFSDTVAASDRYADVEKRDGEALGGGTGPYEGPVNAPAGLALVGSPRARRVASPPPPAVSASRPATFSKFE